MGAKGAAEDNLTRLSDTDAGETAAPHKSARYLNSECCTNRV